MPEAWDAAGRRKQGTWVDLAVDNTAPAQPTGLSIDGGEGWSQSNSRTIRWTNPGSAAPIAGAQVQVCLTGTSDCRTSNHDGGSIAAVGGIGGFAGPGDYTVRVSVRDEAGNHDPAALSQGVRLRFDNLAPGPADPRQANGWLNAAERAAYQQHVRLDDGAFEPKSGVAGYSVTVDGSDPGRLDRGIGRGRGPPDQRPAGRRQHHQGASHFGRRRRLDRRQVGAGAGRPDKPVASVEGQPDPARWQNGPVTFTLRGTDQAALSGMEPGEPVAAGRGGCVHRLPDRRR